MGCNNNKTITLGFLCIYSSPLVSILQRTQKKKISFQAINTTDTTCHNKKN